MKHSNCVWNAWDILTALFPVLRVFWRNNMVSAVENTSWKALEMPFLRLWIWPSRTCTFGAISKATYHSVSACFLKTFWQPWKEVPFLSKMVYEWKIKGVWPSGQSLLHEIYIICSVVTGRGTEISWQLQMVGFTKNLSKVEKRENENALFLYVFNIVWIFALTS